MSLTVARGGYGAMQLARLRDDGVTVVTTVGAVPVPGQPWPAPGQRPAELPEAVVRAVAVRVRV
jgi:hypothetical protein